MSNCTIMVKQLCSQFLIGVQGAKPPARKTLSSRGAPAGVCDEGSRADRVVPRSARCHNDEVCSKFPYNFDKVFCSHILKSI